MRCLVSRFRVRIVFVSLFTLGFLAVQGQKKMTKGELEHYRQLYDIGEYDRILSEMHYKNFVVDFDLLDSQALEIKDDPKILVMRASAYLDLGTLDLSLDDLNRAKKRIPNDPYLYFTLGNYSLDMGDIKNALKNYKKSVEIYPDDEKVYFMMAIAYNEIGNYKRSIEIFETLTNTYPQAKYNIAISYLQNDQPEVAMEMLDDLETVYKDDSDFFFYRAESKYQRNDKAGACMDYKKSADLGDEEADSIYNKYCLQNKKKAKSGRIKTGAVQF